MFITPTFTYLHHQSRYKHIFLICLDPVIFTDNKFHMDLYPRSASVISMDNNRLMNDFVIKCKTECVHNDQNGLFCSMF